MSELKPCPFCGGEARISVVFIAGEKLYSAHCQNDETACWAASAPLSALWDDKLKAAKAWNMRTKS